MPQLRELATPAMRCRTSFHGNNALWMPSDKRQQFTVAHDQMSAEEIDALEQEAFRFSGVGALER
ncbi:MAG: hypothetical protein VX228_02960 [Pseudomonadota bacterium]|nr:hypothetical protein [Pseudomonadota bacterium]